MSGFNTTKYFGIPPSEQFYTENRYNYLATAGQTTFTATYNIGFVDVYYNGSHLDPTTAFTAADGASIVLTTPASTGASVVIVSKPLVRTVDTYTQSQVNNLVNNYYGVAAGTANAMTVATTPSFTTFVDGMELRFRAVGANTVTNPTLSFNGLAAKVIVHDSGTALTAGDYIANDELTVRYVAALNQFVLVSNRFSSVKAASGYTRLPNGLIMQWGTGTYTAGAAVTFPLAFPSACYGVTIGAGNYNAGATPRVVSVSATAPTTTQFTFGSSDGTAVAAYWTAIGI